MDIDLFMLQFPFGLKPDETMWVIGNGTALVTRGGTAQVYPVKEDTPQVRTAFIQGPVRKDVLAGWLRENIE